MICHDIYWGAVTTEKFCVNCIYLGSLNNFKTITHRVRTLSTEQLHKSMKGRGVPLTMNILFHIQNVEKAQ